MCIFPLLAVLAFGLAASEPVPDSSAKWIAANGTAAGLSKETTAVFRRKFHLSTVEKSVARIAAAGYFELRINGKKADDRVLCPTPSNLNRLVYVTELDVTPLLKNGENTVVVLMGKGFSGTFPKLKMSIGTFLHTGSGWESGICPVVSSDPYKGEVYDARLEHADEWKPVALAQPPGGTETAESSPPCRIVRELAPLASWKAGTQTVYDFGENISGWVRITVHGAPGGTVRLTSGEALRKDGGIDEDSCWHSKTPFQKDCYILKGEGREVWELKFRYNGFRYAAVETENASLDTIRACFVRTAFRAVGDFSCSDPLVTRLFRCFRASYESNFCGYPTDCPHREKRGWTADAHLVMESGLMLYDTAPSYRSWLEQFAACQRPSGALPGVIPGAAGDLICECGTAWDSAVILLPWYLYLYTGNAEPAKRHYPMMKRWLDYTIQRSEGLLPDYGIGDWLHPGRRNKHPWLDPDTEVVAPKQLVGSAYLYRCLTLFVRFARLFGYEEDAGKYARLAEDVRNAFRARFHRGNGIFANGVPTAQALAVDFGLAEESEIPGAVRQLAEQVDRVGGKIAFGMAGGKSVFRVLAAYGHIDSVVRILTQPDYPGYANWLKNGAVTLFEQWDCSESRNHPVFGFFSDVLLQQLAGIAPDESAPGMRLIRFDPKVPRSIHSVNAVVNTPCGPVAVSWKKSGGQVNYSLELPPGCSAKVSVNGTLRTVAGTFSGTIPVEETLPFSQ